MEMSLLKRFDSGPLAMLVGLSALVCCLLAALAFADVSHAEAPAKGLACVESNGKISGRGSTYQNNLQEELAKDYRNDVCGPTGTETEQDKIGGTERGEAGNTMLAYNYVEAEKASATGSGAGLKNASCRTDAFAGTDLPYSNQQLKELNEAPETLVKGEGKTCASTTTFKFPFQPNEPPKEWPDKEAGHEDTTAPIMSFPIGGSSVALPVHITAATCENNAAQVPTELDFTAKEVSRIFGGEALTWNDTELAENNPALKKCPGPITRVVRFDNSGTTNIFKSFLIRGETPRNGGSPTCATSEKEWSFYNGSPNTNWPHTGTYQGITTEGGTCSEIVNGGSSGNPALIAKLKTVEGGIGYADLSNATGAEVEGAGFVLAKVQNATKNEFVSPVEGSTANCTYKVLTLPGATAKEAVGLNPKNSWSNNNELNSGSPANHGNATDLGSLYPICGLTWDLVYTGLHAEEKTPNPISRLTNNQRRTLYSYMSYLLSSEGQEHLATIEYAPLPSTWLPLLRTGFQANF
jgi:ABC-type phosphate transport system substrate-binding protein